MSLISLRNRGPKKNPRSGIEHEIPTLKIGMVAAISILRWIVTLIIVLIVPLFALLVIRGPVSGLISRRHMTHCALGT